MERLAFHMVPAPTAKVLVPPVKFMMLILPAAILLILWSHIFQDRLA